MSKYVLIQPKSDRKWKVHGWRDVLIRSLNYKMNTLDRVSPSLLITPHHFHLAPPTPSHRIFNPNPSSPVAVVVVVVVVRVVNNKHNYYYTHDMLLVQQAHHPASFMPSLKHISSTHHRRNPSAPAVVHVQPSKTPGLLNLAPSRTFHPRYSTPRQHKTPKAQQPASAPNSEKERSRGRGVSDKEKVTKSARSVEIEYSISSEHVRGLT